MKMLLECTAPQRPPSSYKYCIAMKLHGGRCSPWPNVQTRAKLHKGRLGKWIKRDTQSRLDLRRQGLCTAHHRFLINHENIRRVVRLQNGSGWVKEISASLQVWNQKTLLCVWQQSMLELLTLRENVLKKTLVLTVFPQNTMLGRSTGIDQNTLTHTVQSFQCQTPLQPIALTCKRIIYLSSSFVLPFDSLLPALNLLFSLLSPTWRRTAEFGFKGMERLPLFPL